MARIRQLVLIVLVSHASLLTSNAAAQTATFDNELVTFRYPASWNVITQKRTGPDWFVSVAHKPSGPEILAYVFDGYGDCFVHPNNHPHLVSDVAPKSGDFERVIWPSSTEEVRPGAYTTFYRHRKSSLRFSYTSFCAPPYIVVFEFRGSENQRSTELDILRSVTVKAELNPVGTWQGSGEVCIFRATHRFQCDATTLLGFPTGAGTWTSDGKLIYEDGKTGSFSIKAGRLTRTTGTGTPLTYRRG
jgi:hypothetical protein